MKRISVFLSAVFMTAFLAGNSSLAAYPAPVDSLPSVFPKNHSDIITSNLKNEASIKFGTHILPENAAEWNVYRTRLKNEIISKAGIKIDHNLPVNMKETATLERQGYKIKNIYFQTRAGVYATANLYIPDGKGPFPGVIVMCGHSTNGRLYDNYQSVGHTLALNGYVALAIDPWGAGERTTQHGQFEYHGANLGASLMNIGESLMGAQVSDNMRGVDLLCSLPYVDKNNIGATGASGGGNQTMWVTAMDERIKAGVPVVSVGTFESYVMNSNCVCELLIDGLTFTEESGVLALARAIMPSNHKKDSNGAFNPSEMLRSYNNAKPIFAMTSSADNLSYRIFDLVHGYYPEDRAAMLGWFDLKLKGIGDGSPKKETSFELTPAEQLMTFTAGNRDPLVVSTEEYCRKRGNELRSEYLSGKLDAAKKRTGLNDVLRINERSELLKAHRYPAVNGWQRAALETTDGKLIPLVFIEPANKNAGYIILSDPSGKKNIPLSYIDELMKKGAGIAVPDLTGTGEASSTKEARTGNTMVLHTLARAELWLGKSVMGEWVKELNVVAGYLKSDLKAQKITVDGRKEAGLAGLFLGASKGNVDEIILNESPVSYLFDNRSNIDFFSLGIHIPGFLNWGDVSLAAALSGKPVTFNKPVTMSGQPVTGDILAKYRSEYEKINSMVRGSGKTIFN